MTTSIHRRTKPRRGVSAAQSETKDVRPIRCAIYTRKSTEEGLQQEFNSLDQQRDSCENYIRSQEGQGWVCLPDRYDDGGFTGGNMDRPALQRLIADIAAGKVDCVVVYKVDRLSRSLMDFSKMMDQFERQEVSFVSVTQHFNTTSSMGRLTLNILLSFAQFERESISERTREKWPPPGVAASGPAGRPHWGTTRSTPGWSSTNSKPIASAKSSGCTLTGVRSSRWSRNSTTGAW